MTFLGLSFALLDGRICALASSAGDGIADLNGNGDGLQLDQVLQFICEQRATDRVLVAYDMAREWELLFSSLPGQDKDRAFAVAPPSTDPENQREESFNYQQMRLRYWPGKRLIVKWGKTGRCSVRLFDVSAFFSWAPLADVTRSWLAIELPRTEKNLLALWSESLQRELLARLTAEAQAIAALTEKVEKTVARVCPKLKQWYGPAAIATRLLSEWKARGQCKRFAPGKAPYQMVRAIDCAYFGGRVELVRNGTVRDVRTFDLNAAYAAALVQLSVISKPLRYSRQYEPAPFSLWLCEYELPEAQIGILPTRSKKGGISFCQRGRGWFWQPEIEYLQRWHQADCKIFGGYICDYKPVRFADAVRQLYAYRDELKLKGDPAHAVIKLALVNLYGKFAQIKGGAYFQCRAWAGWITSWVRARLLEAMRGLEQATVCFAQDAIHLAGSEATEAVELGPGLGQWKRAQFSKGLYLGPGIYVLGEKETDNYKQAQRGSNLTLDWHKLATELSQRQATAIERTLFVGWQAARIAPIRYEQDYLKAIKEKLPLIPVRWQSRHFVAAFDWLSESRQSTIVEGSTGIESARYVPQEHYTGALALRLKDERWR